MKLLFGLLEILVISWTFVAGNLDCIDGEQKGLSDFHNYKVCKNGTWLKKSCPDDSIYWKAIHCCVPLALYPCAQNCLSVMLHTHVVSGVEGKKHGNESQHGQSTETQDKAKNHNDTTAELHGLEEEEADDDNAGGNIEIDGATNHDQTTSGTTDESEHRDHDERGETNAEGEDIEEEGKDSEDTFYADAEDDEHETISGEVEGNQGPEELDKIIDTNGDDVEDHLHNEGDVEYPRSDEEFKHYGKDNKEEFKSMEGTIEEEDPDEAVHGEDDEIEDETFFGVTDEENEDENDENMDEVMEESNSMVDRIDTESSEVPSHQQMSDETSYPNNYETMAHGDNGRLEDEDRTSQLEENYDNDAMMNEEDDELQEVFDPKEGYDSDESYHVEE